MEAEIQSIKADEVKLDDTAQKAVITFVKHAYDKGIKERKKYQDHWERAEKAYHCEMEPINSPEMEWASNGCLPWVYDAVESAVAHIHNTTIPKNDKVFTISGRTDEDHKGAEIMEKYMSYCFERNRYPEQLGKAFHQLYRKNHTCLKVYWKTEETTAYKWVTEPVIDPFTGQQQFNPETGAMQEVRRKQPETIKTFNNVWIDVVPIEQFVMYPISGELNQTTRIHKTHRFYEDLMASAEQTNYFNLEDIKLDDEGKTDTERPDLDTTSMTHETLPKGMTSGLEIKEAWIHRLKIGDKVYRNYVATIVNDKTLIRFQPSPYPDGTSPFVFMALKPDGENLYGYGLCSKGLDILDKANRLWNAKSDGVSLAQHPPHKYYDDGIFDPNNVVARPGAMIPMSGPESVAGNLIPVMSDLSGLQLSYTEIGELKAEFESVTVPKVVKGMIETGHDATATEIQNVQNNSSGKMHVDAFNINDKLIKPTVSSQYQLVYERQGWDDEVRQDIQTVTQPKDENGNFINELPLLPLPNVDIKVVGYQNTIRKQEMLQNIGQIIPQLSESPAGKYLNWENISEDIANLADLDSERLFVDEEKRKEMDDKAEAQQQEAIQHQQELEKMEVQKELEKLKLQEQKQQQDYDIKLKELEIKEAELGIKQEEIGLKEQEINIKEGEAILRAIPQEADKPNG